MTKKTFFFQGALLTLISLFLRVANMGYRSYLSQKVGPEGMGLYQLIFSIFLLTVTLSTSGRWWPGALASACASAWALPCAFSFWLALPPPSFWATPPPRPACAF